MTPNPDSEMPIEDSNKSESTTVGIANKNSGNDEDDVKVPQPDETTNKPNDDEEKKSDDTTDAPVATDNKTELPEREPLEESVETNDILTKDIDEAASLAEVKNNDDDDTTTTTTVNP